MVLHTTRDSADTPALALTQEAARALLAFYGELGVDTAVNEDGWNRLAACEAERPRAEMASAADRLVAAAPTLPPPDQSPSAPRDRAPTLPSQAVVAAAVAAASASRNLAELRAALEAFEGCNLKTTATHLVFSDGLPEAPVMLVGSPDFEDDVTGRPFAGEGGALLDRMLAAIGLDRGGVYLTTAIPWRPPGGRLPTPIEQDICRPFLERHIELARPRCLVLLGGFATGFVLRTTTALTRLRGKWHQYPLGEGAIPVLPMLDPNFLLKKPDQKRLAWTDLQRLKARIDADFADVPENGP